MDSYRRNMLMALAFAGALGFCPALGAYAASPGLPANFAPVTLRGSGPRLRAWLRSGQGDMLHVFIEGDGHIWQKGYPNTDPTPREPISARLAADTPIPAPVLYLARPGQYASAAELEQLSSKWWTSHRYSQVVVDAVTSRVLEAMLLSGCSRIGLYGHSGGGVLAVLAAAALADKTSLVGTAGSPLDTEHWGKRYDARGLPESLNPKTVAKKIAGIRQFHLSGERDKVVPSSVLDSWLDELRPLPAHIERVIVPDAAHKGPWLMPWRITMAKAVHKLPFGL